jgi:hypothetical protein
MAFKLSREQGTRWVSMNKELAKEHDQLTAAVEQFNATVQTAFSDLGGYAQSYNQTLEHAKELVDEIASEWRSELENKSEAWQEGERGQELSEKIDELEGFAPDEFEVVEFELQDAPDEDVVGNFGDLKPE